MPSTEYSAEERTQRRGVRRPHSKVTTGCLLCRRRRVKCTEERPKCKSCLRRDAACEYPDVPRRRSRRPEASRTSPATINATQSSPRLDLSDDAAGRSHSSTPSASHASEAPRLSSASSTPAVPTIPTAAHSATSADSAHYTSDSAQTSNLASLSSATPLSSAESSTFNTATSPSSSSSSSTFQIRDLALLHHWTVSTSVEIFRAWSLRSLWQVTFPQIGFEHPFVAHAILSLAALHLAYIEEGSGKTSYIFEATRHYEKALEGFHEAIRHLSEDNSEAIVVWSILNVIYVFGISRQLPDDAERTEPRHRKDRVLGLEWIPMMRGVEAVLGPTYDFLRTGRMRSVLSLGNWDELDPEKMVPEPMDTQLCRLRETWATSSDFDVYEQALHILRKCRMYILQFESMDDQTVEQWGCNRGWSGPLLFIHFASQEYFTLLHQRQPPALMLFAYFGALLHGASNYWFMEGLGRDIVEVVDELLGSYWRTWIAWPLEHVGICLT